MPSLHNIVHAPLRIVAAAALVFLILFVGAILAYFPYEELGLSNVGVFKLYLIVLLGATFIGCAVFALIICALRIRKEFIGLTRDSSRLICESAKQNSNITHNLLEIVEKRDNIVEQRLADLYSLLEKLSSLNNLVRLEARESRRQIEASLALYTTLAPRVPLEPMQDWALSSDSAAWIIAKIAEIRPKRIVELGSGVSTVLIALQLRRSGLTTEFISIEHDPAYAEKTAQSLCREGLDDLVQIVQAPLTDVSIDGATYRWYSPSFIANLGKVDLLLIDGPPGATGKHARFPALPLFSEHLSQDAIIILDDALRDDEQEILGKWRDLSCGARFAWTKTRQGGKGLAVGYSTSGD